MAARLAQLPGWVSCSTLPRTGHTLLYRCIAGRPLLVVLACPVLLASPACPPRCDLTAPPVLCLCLCLCLYYYGSSIIGYYSYVAMTLNVFRVKP